MISFVTWLWNHGSEARFLPHHVNVLRAMLERHCHRPHRLVCVTDEPEGIDSRVHILPTPVHMHGIGNLMGERFPACWRRLWNFSDEAREHLGERIVALDLDVVVVRELDPLLDRDESFVGWVDGRSTWNNKIAGGAYMLKTGSHTNVWHTFDPQTSPGIAHAAGHRGSDQSWISHCLFPPPGCWTMADGLYSIKWIKKNKPLPKNARIVSTPGDRKPWDPRTQAMFPWIVEHWRI